MPSRNCCIPGCDGKSTRRLSFPTRPDTLKIWLERINNPKLSAMDPSQLRQKFKVCSSHFEPQCFTGLVGRLRLSSVALPTKNLPGYTSVPEDWILKLSTPKRTTPPRISENVLRTTTIVNEAEHPVPSRTQKSKTLQPRKNHVDMNALKRGALIVVEGVDRSGKSTQCRKIVQSLADWGVKAQLLSFPDRTTSTGKLIDEYLRNKEVKMDDHAIHLLFSANRWESYEKMKKLLYNGVTLIVDRYSYSGIAFSSAKKTMDFLWCQQPENGLFKPDVTFLLSLSENDIDKRPGFGEERYENLDFQQKVMEYYDLLFSEAEGWVRIDATMDIEQVHDEMLTKVLNTIPLVEKTPVKKLNFMID